MFEAATSKFVKSVGQSSLIASPSLDVAYLCKPLQVVIKKNRRWCWQSAKYEPTPFQLHQLLTTPDPMSDEVKVSSRKLTTYNKTYKFSVNGKIGATLKALLDIELSGSDAVDVEAKFGDITKDEVDQPALMKTLESRALDLKHEFVEQVRENPKKVFCVIVGTAKLAEDGEVHMRVSVKGEENVDLPKIPDVTKEEEDAVVTDTSDKKLDVPKDTPVAYDICELWVKADGTLELIVDKDSRGGFANTDSTDAGELESIKDPSLHEMFKGILQMKKAEREALCQAVLELCANPSDIDPIFLLLKHTHRGLPSTEEQTKPLPDIYGMGAAKTVLTMAGFTVQEDKQVKCPSEKTPALEGILCLFEALMELDDDEALALHQCDRNLADALLYLLSNTLEDQELTTTDPQLAPIFSQTGPGQSFTQSLGFQVTATGTVLPSEATTKELEGAYRVVYALWWDPQEAAKKGHSRSHCIVL